MAQKLWVLEQVRSLEDPGEEQGNQFAKGGGSRMY